MPAIETADALDTLAAAVDALRHGPGRERYDDANLDRLADDAARIASGEYRPAYNGWKNRETWNASLWINNDAGLYETARDMVRDAMDADPYQALRSFTGSAPDDPDTLRRAQLTRAGDALRGWYEETFAPENTAGPLSDAWTYAVAVADWYAVADGLAEDLPTTWSLDA